MTATGRYALFAGTSSPQGEGVTHRNSLTQIDTPSDMDGAGTLSDGNYSFEDDRGADVSGDNPTQPLFSLLTGE